MSYYCDVDEVATVYAEKRVKARKPKKCCETGRVIQPGEYYWRCEMLFDGHWDRFVQCEDAYRFARKINGVEPYDPTRRDSCIPFGAVDEYMRECCERPELIEEWNRIKEGAQHP